MSYSPLSEGAFDSFGSGGGILRCTSGPSTFSGEGASSRRRRSALANGEEPVPHGEGGRDEEENRQPLSWPQMSSASRNDDAHSIDFRSWLLSVTFHFAMGQRLDHFEDGERSSVVLSGNFPWRPHRGTWRLSGLNPFTSTSALRPAWSLHG